jgi:hypothetical protein
MQRLNDQSTVFDELPKFYFGNEFYPKVGHEPVWPVVRLLRQVEQ